MGLIWFLVWKAKMEHVGVVHRSKPSSQQKHLAQTIALMNSTYETQSQGTPQWNHQRNKMTGTTGTIMEHVRQ